MDKALAWHVGGQGVNQDKTLEDFLCLEKNQICVPISSGYPHHVLYLSLLMAGFYKNSGLTCYWGDRDIYDHTIRRFTKLINNYLRPQKRSPKLFVCVSCRWKVELGPQLFGSSNSQIVFSLTFFRWKGRGKIHRESGGCGQPSPSWWLHL